MDPASIALVATGMVMVGMAGTRLRSTMTEGMHEYYRGQLCKVSRLEQPRSYWARLTLMVSTCAAGVMLLCEGTALLHM